MTSKRIRRVEALDKAMFRLIRVYGSAGVAAQTDRFKDLATAYHRTWRHLP